MGSKNVKDIPDLSIIAEEHDETSEEQDFSVDDVNELFLEKLQDKCKNCNQLSDGFITLDTGIKLSLQTILETSEVPEKVCESCYQELVQLVAKGTKLRARKIAQQEFKRNIWKSRMNFVKKGREDLRNNNLSSSAIHYEKYLQSLKIGFNIESGDIMPSLFKGEVFRKEYLVVTHVYLDLFRIYDQSNRSFDRLEQVAQQLKSFGNHPSVRSQVIRKLRLLSRSSNNRETVIDVLKTLDNNSARCFIATAAFQSPQALEVQWLCAFRDQILKSTHIGRNFIAIYYKFSPALARWLDHHPVARKITQKILKMIAFTLRHIFKLEK